MNLFDLSNKSAIVTGGNGGIGLGMARGLAAAGAAIAVAGRNPEKNAAARKELDALGSGKVISVEVDVTNSESVTRMVTDTVEQLGGIDILVNNAGTNIRKRAEELPEDEWHTVINTNLTSAYLCSKACYPAMKAAGGGKVLNNGSMLSLFG
ncbi:MAG: SDR family NAD(P)-dependent oxidoreductase, partial [Chromatiales bacterium]|nr:SDR family NAD(P)-dependent oxidoreductase [Chromatiales bacterium]